jgi:Ca-activated chloride channel family protein
MSILVPAALVFSAIIPIILLFYFMRPKRQERVVGSTLIWQQALQDLQASRPWQRLRITPLLLLQLLAALFIVLVLIRPAILSNNPLSGNTIIILQASASMQATDIAPNRFESAKNTINDLIDNLGTNDSLSLITMARHPQVLIADSSDKTQLHEAVQRARVTNQDADLEEALALATSLAQGRANTQILVIGDGHVINPDQALIIPIPVRYMRIGTDAPNVALTALSSQLVNGKLSAFAQVANYSKQQRTVPVELYADNKLVSVQSATIPAEGTSAIHWPALPLTTRFLHAHLLSQDPLMVDHDAWSIVGSSTQGKVLLVTHSNPMLETALRIQPNIDLYEVSPQNYANGGNYDLTIFDGFVPPVLPKGSILFVNPPQGSYPFGTSGQDIKVSHINTGNDPSNLLAEVDLSTIHVLQDSHLLKPAPWASPVITTPETPLLLAGTYNNQRIAVLGFDLHDSDFALQYTFPILIRNLANWFLPPPVAGDAQITPGTPVTIQAWPGASKVTITTPGQQVVQVGPPITPFSATDQVGLYQVNQLVRGQKLSGAFTINLFDPSQSNLAPAATLPILHSTDFTTTGTTSSHELREIWPWIAALLLLVLCIEWWLFSRSYQTSGHGSEAHKGLLGTKRGGPQNALNRSLQSAVDRLAENYRLLRKRITKVSKRTRKKFARQKAKGNTRANI